MGRSKAGWGAAITTAMMLAACGSDSTGGGGPISIPTSTPTSPSGTLFGVPLPQTFEANTALSDGQPNTSTVLLPGGSGPAVSLPTISIGANFVLSLPPGNIQVDAYSVELGAGLNDTIVRVDRSTINELANVDVATTLAGFDDSFSFSSDDYIFRSSPPPGFVNYPGFGEGPPGEPTLSSSTFDRALQPRGQTEVLNVTISLLNTETNRYRLVHAVTGVPTADSAIPTAGSGSYLPDVAINFTNSAGHQYVAAGFGTLTVDFETGEVSGSFSIIQFLNSATGQLDSPGIAAPSLNVDPSGAVIIEVSGSIDGNGFSATTSSAGIGVGRAVGQFFGPQADALGIVFEVNSQPGGGVPVIFGYVTAGRDELQDDDGNVIPGS